MRQFLSIAKALADENRVRILMFLRSGELCVCQIIEMLRLAPSTVSKHLALLYQAGLVETRKEGRWIYYRLAGEEAPPCAREALGWVQRSLADAPMALDDARRLEAVRGMNPSELCSHYRIGPNSRARARNCGPVSLAPARS